MVHTLRLILDVDDHLVLLLDQHRHLLEHLCQFRQRLFDFLDLGVSLLDLSVCSPRRAIPVRVEQLESAQNGYSLTVPHRLREDLRVVRLGHLPDLLLGRVGVDNLVLPLHPVLDLFPKLLLNDLVLLQQGGEPGLDRLDLVLHRLVPLGELEQPFNLVLALFARRSGLVVELVRVRRRAGVRRRLA